MALPLKDTYASDWSWEGPFSEGEYQILNSHGIVAIVFAENDLARIMEHREDQARGLDAAARALNPHAWEMYDKSEPGIERDLVVADSRRQARVALEAADLSVLDPSSNPTSMPTEQHLALSDSALMKTLGRSPGVQMLFVDQPDESTSNGPAKYSEERIRRAIEVLSWVPDHDGDDPYRVKQDYMDRAQSADIALAILRGEVQNPISNDEEAHRG